MDEPPKTTLRQEIVACLPALIPIFIDVVGVSVILPLVPVHVNAIGAPVEAVGTVLTANFLGQMLGVPIFGAFSDRYGPKRGLLLSMLGNAIFFTLSAFMPTVPALAAVRFFGAMSNAMGAGQKWIVDATTIQHRERVMTGVVMCFLVGFLVGAGIGAATGSWLIGCLITAGGSAAAGLVLLFLKEPVSNEERMRHREADAEAKRRGDAVPSVRDGLKAPGFWLSTTIALAGGLLFGTMSTLSGVVLLDQYELTGDTGAFWNGISYYIAIAFVLATQFTVAPLLQKFVYGELAMTFGPIVGGAMLIACGFLYDLPTFWPFLVCAMPTAFACLVLSLVPADVALSAAIEKISPDLTGVMMGLQKLVNFGAVAVAPIVSVGIYVHDPRLAFVLLGSIVTALGILCMLVAVIFRKRLLAARQASSSPAPTVAGGTVGDKANGSHASPAKITKGIVPTAVIDPDAAA